MDAARPVEARYYSKGPGGAALCSLCHHRCRVAPGGSGACRVRVNRAGRLELPFYGLASSVAVDPIEKKPLYHFLPGSATYSVGYLGCNLHCPFCQNFAISQATDARTRRVEAAELARAALESGCRSVAHTYSEPLVHAEFVEACMRASRGAGLRNVLVTNGCAEADAANSVLSLCDAVNVDVKAWDEAFYRDELGGERATVLGFIEAAVRQDVHVEATMLVIPGKNDDDGQVEGVAAFLASLSPDIPLHVTAYRPMYRYTEPATPSGTVRRLVDRARRSLRYVYPGNLAGERSLTACRACGSVLVSRRGYAVDASGLRGSRCASCGAESPIMNESEEIF